MKGKQDKKFYSIRSHTVKGLTVKDLSLSLSLSLSPVCVRRRAFCFLFVTFIFFSSISPVLSIEWHQFYPPLITFQEDYRMTHPGSNNRR